MCSTVADPVETTGSIFMDSIHNPDHLQPNPFARELLLEQVLAEFQEVCRRAYWEGAKAARRGIRKNQNPYPQYSGGAYFWQIGHIGPK